MPKNWHMDEPQRLAHRNLSAHLLRQVTAAENAIRHLSALAPELTLRRQLDEDNEVVYTPHCPACGKPVEPDAIAEIASSGLLRHETSYEADGDDVTVFGDSERQDMHTLTWQHITCAALVRIPADWEVSYE